MISYELYISFFELIRCSTDSGNVQYILYWYVI